VVLDARWQRLRKFFNDASLQTGNLPVVNAISTITGPQKK
jgi:hypothetical protein